LKVPCFKTLWNKTNSAILVDKRRREYSSNPLEVFNQQFLDYFLKKVNLYENSYKKLTHEIVKIMAEEFLKIQNNEKIK